MPEDPEDEYWIVKLYKRYEQKYGDPEDNDDT